MCGVRDSEEGKGVWRERLRGRKQVRCETQRRGRECGVRDSEEGSVSNSEEEKAAVMKEPREGRGQKGNLPPQFRERGNTSTA